MSCFRKLRTVIVLHVIVRFAAIYLLNERLCVCVFSFNPTGSNEEWQCFGKKSLFRKININAVFIKHSMTRRFFKMTFNFHTFWKLVNIETIVFNIQHIYIIILKVNWAIPSWMTFISFWFKNKNLKIWLWIAMGARVGNKVEKYHG